MCILVGLAYLIVNPSFEFMQGIWVYVSSVYNTTEFFAMPPIIIALFLAPFVGMFCLTPKFKVKRLMGYNIRMGS